MSITFATPTRDDLLAGHDAFWRGALAGLGVAETESPELYAVMPYAHTQLMADQHVDRCAVCSGGSFLDLCPQGERLFGLAADACAAQSDLADQN